MDTKRTIMEAEFWLKAIAGIEVTDMVAWTRVERSKWI